MSKKIERIKENVTSKEYKKLMEFVREHDNLRENSKLNLMRAFTILFYTGLRVNELQALRVGDIKELIKNRSVKVELDKTSTERKLYLSDDFEEELLSIFDLEEDSENRVIAKGANKNKKDGIHP
ncbi:MAG: site-specific integrase, partial [Epsilonproteobacteria bacterium]|nr:site-specific integrase [Campylobacterota bacterium]